MRSMLKTTAGFKISVSNFAHLLVEIASAVELSKTNDRCQDDEESNLSDGSVVLLPALEFCLSGSSFRDQRTREHTDPLKHSKEIETVKVVLYVLVRGRRWRR